MNDCSLDGSQSGQTPENPTRPGTERPRGLQPKKVSSLTTNGEQSGNHSTSGPTPVRHLAELAATLRQTSSRKEKTTLVAELLARLAPDEIEPAIGILLADLRQGAIGVGWATVAAAQPRETASSPDSPNAGLVSILDLDALVDRLAATTGPGSVEARVSELSGFLARCDDHTADYISRILTGDARQGALAGVLTEAAAKAAGVKAAAMRRAVMLQGDLGQAAKVALVDGEAALVEINLVVQRPIQPMLASTAADVGEAINSVGQASVEWKLDGARIQLHVSRDAGSDPESDTAASDGRRIAIYTRNLNPVTDRLRSVQQVAEQLDCRSAVLDGEVLGFFTDDDGQPGESPQAFQDTMSTFGTQAPGAAGGLRPHFFDLMYLDGESLIDKPLTERLELLHDLLERSGVPSTAIPQILTDDVQRAQEHFDAALAAGHEGVMVKAADSRYEAGRRGKSWRKVKPVHTLDLLVLGAEWGHGRRQGWLSNLHLGARDPDSGEFVMVGKTFKGLTDELLAWQTEQFLALQRSEDKQSGRHTVLIRPELVVEIALDGAQTSTRYPGGVALRFARVRRYREDKDPTDVDTLDAVRALL